MVLPKRLIVCVALTVFAVNAHARAYHGGDGDGKDGGGIDRGGYGGGGGSGGGGGGGGGHGHGHGHGHASSYQHFSGPVVGDHQEISWKDKHGHHHHDYVAYPKYSFSYGVDDHHTKDHHGHKEYRDGKQTHGEFHIHEPGGNIKVVKYHADPHSGFHAEVHNHGGNDHSGGTYGGHKHR